MKRVAVCIAVVLASVLAHGQSIGPNQVKPGTFQGGAYTFPGSISSSTADSVVNAARQTGSTGSAKLAACIAKAIADSSGICNARDFGATTQTISAPVVVGDGVHRVHVIFNPATKFVPASGLTTESLFVWRQYSSAEGGPYVDVTGVPGYSGAVLSNYAEALFEWPKVRGARIIQGPTQASSCLALTSTSATVYVQHAEFEIDCTGGTVAKLTATGTDSDAWVNNNILTLKMYHNQHGLVIFADGPTNATQVSQHRIFINQEAFAFGTVDRSNVEDVVSISTANNGVVVDNDYAIYVADNGTLEVVKIAAGALARSNYFHGVMYYWQDLSAFGVGNIFCDVSKSALCLSSGTFQQDGSGNLNLKPTIPATASVGRWSPDFNFTARYWNGSADADDSCSLRNQAGNGTNPAITFGLSCSGSSGARNVSFPYPFSSGSSTVTLTGDGEAYKAVFPGGVDSTVSLNSGTMYSGTVNNANVILGALTSGKTAALYGGGYAAVRANADGTATVKGGSAVLYRCVGGTYDGFFVSDGAKCTGGSATDSGLRVQ